MSAFLLHPLATFVYGMFFMLFAIALCRANETRCERAPMCKEWVA